jgi:hypothetical protein
MLSSRRSNFGPSTGTTARSHPNSTRRPRKSSKVCAVDGRPSSEPNPRRTTNGAAQKSVERGSRRELRVVDVCEGLRCLAVVLDGREHLGKKILARGKLAASRPSCGPQRLYSPTVCCCQTARSPACLGTLHSQCVHATVLVVRLEREPRTSPTRREWTFGTRVVPESKFK